MSVHAVERVLWECANDPMRLRHYEEDRDGYLGQFALTAEEKKHIVEMDVKALADQGASQMLLMMFWTAVHRTFAELPEYLRRLNA